MAGLECLVVAEGLSSDQLPEIEIGFRHRDEGFGVVDDLDEHAGRRPTFVKLACRM